MDPGLPRGGVKDTILAGQSRGLGAESVGDGSRDKARSLQPGGLHRGLCPHTLGLLKRELKTTQPSQLSWRDAGCFPCYSCK